jgi:hypothetical protein
MPCLSRGSATMKVAKNLHGLPAHTLSASYDQICRRPPTVTSRRPKPSGAAPWNPMERLESLEGLEIKDWRNVVPSEAAAWVVGPPGLEPGSAGYEPGALPLSYRPPPIIA